MKKQLTGLNVCLLKYQNNMFEKAKLKSKEIIDSFSITSAPVPVESIVESLGIKISYAPSTDYSGMLIRKSDGAILMGVNNSESSQRIRFTIAHELGHYFLDKQKVTVDYRNKNYSSSKPTKEKEADFFAANLLMPESFVVNDFKSITNDKIFLEEDLEKMADKYQTSKEAMYYRLVNLNLIKVKRNDVSF